MKHFYKILLIFFIVTSGFAQPKVGDVMPCAFSESIHYAISSSQFVYGCEYIFNGINYFVGTIDKSHISYISTTDTLFKSPEGIHVGSTHKDVLKKGGSEIMEEIGFAYLSKLPSGWYVSYSGAPGLGSKTQIDSLDKLNIIYFIDKSDSTVHKFFKY
jgi:hypothetical protein